MSNVRLEFLSRLADTLGVEKTNEEVVLEVKTEGEKTVRGILSELAIKYPRFGELVFDVKTQKLIARVAIFCNGSHLELANGLETRIKDGDVLAFLPPLEGG